jgi:hypothetical protein
VGDDELSGRTGLVLLGRLSEFNWAAPAPAAPRVLLLLATESPRLSPVAACTLHLLLTLSDRFIIALSTKPPRPLVGDGGLLEDPQPGNAVADDSVELPSLAESSIGAILGVESGID